jgi:phage baseplate assembly protein gpV
VTLTLYDTIRRIVREELRQVRTAELAVVQEQHPHASASDTDNYACTVRLRDSAIVLKHVPVATQRIGLVSVPSVGDLVLVQFIGGDINAPVITGRLYNDEDRPPPSDDAQAVLHLPLGAGDDDAVHAVLSSGDKRELTLRLGGGLSVALRDDDPVVELEVDGGKAKIAIERDGAVTVESQGAVKLKGGQLSIEGDTISVEASGELTLKGATVNIN